jgi:methylmalonyl-CoA/ethylmalonyl-CoA epimerase
MNLGRLNHVGVATPSIEKSVALYRDMLGATRIHEPFDLPLQGVGSASSTRPTAR